MYWFLFFFLFWGTVLFGSDHFEYVDFGGHPSALVKGCVNVITGDYVVKQNDLVVRGVEPIHIQRRYFMRYKDDEYAGWECGFNHLIAFRRHGKTDIPERMGVTISYVGGGVKSGHLKLFDPENVLTNSALGELSARNNPLNNSVYFKEGDIKELIVEGPDGTKRFYRTFAHISEMNQNLGTKYHLRSELLPSGNKIIYHWGKREKERILDRVETKDCNENILAWVNINYENPGDKWQRWKRIETSDGRVVTYRFHRKFEHNKTKYNLLKKIEFSDRPDEILDPYWESEKDGVYVSWVKHPECRFRNIHHYHLGANEGVRHFISKKDAEEDHWYKRVRLLYEPVGRDQTPIRTYKFVYEPAIYKKRWGYTDVYDAYDNRTRYRYNEKYWLTHIESYKGEFSLISKELFHWDEKGWLTSKAIADGSGVPLSATLYDYDSKGNVIFERLCGNLVGVENRKLLLQASNFPNINHADCYQVKRTYTNNNLLETETYPNGRKIAYSYLGNTNLIVRKLIYDKEQITHRQFNNYVGSVLVSVIIDDGKSLIPSDLRGVTQRTVKQIKPKRSAPFYGFPEEIEEQYYDLDKGCILTLRKQVMTYNNRGLVEKIDYYDAEGVFRYSLEYQYDSRGRLSKQKDPLGRWRTVTYDANDNPLIDNDPNENFFLKSEYDFSNRPTVSTQVAESGLKQQISLSYNHLSQKISETNEQGNTTQVEYDPFGHPTSIIFPTGACVSKTYNALGKVEEETDPEGNTTKYHYTSRGQPYRITHPDGAEEQFTYTLEGEVATHTTPEGTITQYEYDIFNRVTSKKVTKGNALLSEEHYKYSTFQLLEKTDPDGVVTTYSYDGAGRKIKEQTLDRVTLFAYDSLGRLEKVTKCVGIDQVILKKYDLLDRVIEEQELDSDGNLYGYTLYSYDDFSNKEALTKEVHKGESVVKYKYDPFRRLISQTDPLGHEIAISYNDHFINEEGKTVIQKITIDPMGRRTIETMDVLGRLAELEKQDSDQTILLKENFFYDQSGNKVKQVSTLFNPNKVITKSWKYDSRGRVIELLEADQKRTTYSYTPDGHLEALTKPDGEMITYTYDGLGRQTSIQTSDGNCHYSLRYDLMGYVIESHDHIDNHTTKRHYNHFGDLTHETLANRYSMHSEFDPLSRKTSLRFSDGSSVEYSYDPYHLQSVSRLDQSGRLMYEHVYTAYDFSHNLLEEQPIGELKPIQHEVDLLSRRTSTHNHYSFEQIPQFDPNGNPLEYLRQVQDHQEHSRFTYDALNQLTLESGPFNHDYSYDSHHNRLHKDETDYEVDALHQLVSTTHATYDHDPNGNRIATHSDDHEVSYTYDGLNRLTQVRSGDRAVRFSYDSWNRCIRRINLKLVEGAWVAYPPIDYLYDGSNEIGIFPTHIRILGQGHGAEIGATIAIEHYECLYVPTHDLFGNIIALLTPEGETIESYRYTTFGEEEITTEYGLSTTSFLNPWRYQSKRKETHLVNFGHRFYDPETGRWLFPDPKGFDEGPNLYQYLLNSPLLHFDLYGLSVEPGEKYSVRNFMSDLKYVYHYTARSTIEGFTTGNPRQMIGPLNAYQAISNVITGNRVGPDIEHSKVYQVGSWRHSNTDFYLMNGVRTSKEEALNMGRIVSSLYNGAEVNVIHNASHGLVVDLMDYFLERSNVTTNIVNLAYKQIMKSIEAGRNPVVEVHSEAAAIYCSLAQKMTPEELSKVTVHAYGPGKIVPAEYGKDVMNYISENDWVSRMGNPINSFRAVSENWSHVQFLAPNSINPLKEHGFLNDTYFDQLLETSYHISTDLGIRK